MESNFASYLINENFFQPLAAINEEKKRQREDLKKQRDQCIARAEKMKREMKDLKKTKDDLIVAHGRRSPSPKTIGFIKQNEKLQVRIEFYVSFSTESD